MGVIIIEAPRTGISQSPHTGFAEVVNLDVTSIPGIAKLNTIMAKKSVAVVDAQITWFARDTDTSANIGALDSNGVFYKSTDSGATWTEISDRSGVGQGLIIKWGYAFVFEVTTIDVIKMSDNSVTSDWQTIGSDSLWHPAFLSKNDGKIYFGCGQYLGSIEQNSGQTFDPANGATYTVTLGTSASNCLDLPASYRIKCIEELGNILMLGTWQGTNIYDIRIADIFPWDRSSVSFGQPIVIDDYGVHAMRNTGNSLIVLAGTSGTVYKCDGVNAYIVAQIPTDLTGGKYLEWYPGAIVNYKNKVFFGVGNGGTTAIAGQGVYSLQQTGKGNILALEHLNSSLTTGSAASVKISALLPVTRDTLLMGWRSNTTYGIDLSSATSYAYTTDYSGYFVSPMYTIGTNLSQRKVTEVEFALARPLRTTEGIKLEHRTDLTADFTEIDTYDYATWAGILSKNIISELPQDVKVCEQVQFKVSLNGSATTSPEFKRLIVKYS